MEEEQLQILHMLEAGQIDADEAAALLAALDTDGPEVVEEEVVLPPEPGPAPRPGSGSTR
jgi:hypothetical protein